MRIMHARPARFIDIGEWLGHPGEPYTQGQYVSETELIKVTEIIEGDAGITILGRCETCTEDTVYQDLGEYAVLWRGELS